MSDYKKRFTRTLKLQKIERHPLSFEVVECGALFVDKNDNLCQKIDYKSYSIIANAKGELTASHVVLGETKDTNQFFVKALFGYKKIKF